MRAMKHIDNAYRIKELKMSCHVLLIVFASVALAVNQNSQQPESPQELLCGTSTSGERRCVNGGVLNDKVVSVELPVYPQKAAEKQIEGTVTVTLLYNEDGEVISARPHSGPEGLWATAVKAAVNTRFPPTKLSGKPIKVTGALHVSFEDGKVDIPHPKPTRGAPTTVRPRF